MGAGVQEQFLLDLVAQGWSGMGFTCGGYLDQLGNGLRYYPQWIDDANLRWAWRLVREPRRLGPRYLIDYPGFGAQLVSSKMRKRGASKLEELCSIQ
jgi:N-acetylglucosaminyldiphosphoundecaprenol N-acetyl-beta-D-mannosaminyltransferase